MHYAFANSHSLRSYRLRLMRGLRLLRRAYQSTLRKNEKSAAQLAVYQEWLRDNYYLVEREGRAALRELRRVNARADDFFHVAALCRAQSTSGIDGDRLAAALVSARCKSSEIALASLAMRLVLTEYAVESAQGKEPSAQLKLISAAVTGLRALPDLDFSSMLEQVSPLERCLRRDPAGVYPRMEEGSRAVYRYLLEKRAKAKRHSEEAEAQYLIDRATGASGAARHVGTALLEQAKHPRRGRALLVCETVLPVVVSAVLAFALRSWLLFPLLCLPMTAILRVLLEAVFLRGVAPIPLPRMELGGVVPEEGRTLITVAALLPSAAQAESLGRRMEELYSSNGGINVDVCMLADLKVADAAQLPCDEADLAAARQEVERLNEKYGGGFLLAVRHRSYSPTMGNYAGRERKRGAICSLVRAIHDGEADDFRLLCGDTKRLRSFKYLLALDADTQLPFDAVQEMVAAALHPANQPLFDLALGRVTQGYGILAPHVELDLDSARASSFSHAMAGEGGNSPYSNQVSERYQDLFGCGIFAGKGLIHIASFAALEKANPFPEEQVLSHDILEGGYLRAGFLADVHVADGFPARQGSYFTRQERWVRGDWQNIGFMRKKQGLPALSRYQLFDNLRRSLIAPACLFAILVSLLLPLPAAGALAAAGVLGACAGALFSALRCLCSGGLSMLSRDYYAGGLPAALGDFTRGALQLVTLAQEAWTNTSAAARGLWRGLVTRKKRLEWTTAAQGEAAKSRWKPILALWPSLVAAALLLLFGREGQKLIGIILLADLLFAPLSEKKILNDKPKLSEEDRGRIENYCKAMWNYFETYCTADQNYLPPDNVQEAPVFRTAARTSPTNIGLYLLCILAARDLNLIDSAGLSLRLGRTLDSIEQLERWCGNLLNWYDTRTLCPLEPRYVSTVDSGNFLVSIRTLRKGLEEYLHEEPALADRIARLYILEADCDLRPLYHPRRKLFHIGLDLSTGRVSPSYYDLLMSEARMTSYYAIAARIVPKKHWGALGRTLAQQGRFTGPVSWTGTMFEYFMPYLFLPAPRGTLGYEALRFCLSCQKQNAQGLMPWGASESGFYAFDPSLNYQYKAHGVQKLGLRRGLDNEQVYAPYASFLAMQLAPKSALQNLKRFEEMELLGGCGLYEAADATPARTNGQDYAVVRSYMAHHVGMSLLAALNTLQDGILRRRFFADEEMAAARGLLYERIPDRAAVFRDVELRDMPRPRERVSSSKQVFYKFRPAAPQVHLLSNGEWSCAVTDCGASVSFYRGVSIFRQSPDLLRKPGGVLALLREQGLPPVSITPAPYYNAVKSRVEFHASEVLHYAEGKSVAVQLRTRVHPRMPAEIRVFSLKNTEKKSVSGSLWVYFEPGLAVIREAAEHPAFSQLFVTDAYDSGQALATFIRRRGGETICLAAGWSKGTQAVCERSREKALRRGVAFGHTELTKLPRSASGAGDCCAAYEIAYQLAAGETKEWTLYLCAGVSQDEAAARLLHLRHETTPIKRWAACPFREGELPAVLAQQVLPKLLYYAPNSLAQTQARDKLKAARQALWPLGISGEEPFIYVPITSAEDVPAALPWLSLFRRLRAAGIPCELALGYHEGGDYDSPVSAALREAVRRERCTHLENQRGGVRLINLRRADHTAVEALEAYASHVAGRDEETDSQEANDRLLELLTAQSGADDPSITGIVAGQGRFLPGKFIIDKKPLPPVVPWSLPLCNPAFGTLVSDSALGFTWAVNARENKLSPWASDPCRDNRGELLILKFGCQTFDLLAGARCEFTPQYAKWFGEVHGIIYTVTCTVPAKGLCKRVEVVLHNQTDRTLTPALAYYLEPVLGVSREPHLTMQGELLPDGILLHNPAASVSGYSALLLTGGADFKCAARAEFLSGHWNNGRGYPQSDPCAAVGRRLQLPPNGEAVAAFALTWGAQRNAALCAHLVAETQAAPIIAGGFTLPDAALNEMMNTWLPHQVTAGRLWGRTGHAQCGGAWGFRDQLQDVLAMIELRPELARQQIARCAAAQFSEGDALHWWHRLPGHEGVRGVRTRYADDYLWLPFVCAEYVLRSGDSAFLDTKIAFREGAVLAEDESERYAVYYLGREKQSLFIHCVRAVDRALGLMGARGLPLMQGGDWNDGMNRVGAGGKGESVWLAMFFAMVLDRMEKLCLLKNKQSLAEHYARQAQSLRTNIDRHCWAGDRYLRAFWDDGQALGGNGACGIDLLPQCFASLCGLPDKKRVNTALDTALAQLMDQEHGLIRLLKEPFLHDGRRAGYINDYPPGVRENGGQYTHAAVWLYLALRNEGRADNAQQVLDIINPASFCQLPARMAVYRAEPYFLAGDVSGANGCEGRAGWTLYTGSAAWLLGGITNASQTDDNQ